MGPFPLRACWGRASSRRAGAGDFGNPSPDPFADAAVSCPRTSAEGAGALRRVWVSPWVTGVGAWRARAGRACRRRPWRGDSLEATGRRVEGAQARDISNRAGGFGKGPESCGRNPGPETQRKKGAVFGASELRAVSRAGGEEEGGGEAGLGAVKGPLCFPAEARRGFARPRRRGISPRSLRHAMGSVRGPAPPWSRPGDLSLSGGCCDSELVRAAACASPAPSSRGSGSASVAPALAGGRARRAPLPSVPRGHPGPGRGVPCSSSTPPSKPLARCCPPSRGSFWPSEKGKRGQQD